jgi:hypothetical protein
MCITEGIQAAKPQPPNPPTLSGFNVGMARSQDIAYWAMGCKAGNLMQVRYQILFIIFIIFIIYYFDSFLVKGSIVTTVYKIRIKIKI